MKHMKYIFLTKERETEKKKEIEGGLWRCMFKLVQLFSFLFKSFLLFVYHFFLLLLFCFFFFKINAYTIICHACMRPPVNKVEGNRESFLLYLLDVCFNDFYATYF
jgi:hypothetical protein